MKKLLTAALVTLAFTGTATADQIYIDNGFDYGGNNANTAAGDTTTGWKDSLGLVYDSKSTVFDADNNGTISAGDTIHSTGGLIAGAGIGDNNVSTLLTSEVFGSGPSDNDYKTDWLLSFRFTDLMGTYNGSDFIYTSGNVDWLLFDSNSGGAEVHLFTTTISSHTSVPGNQTFFGTVGNFGAGMVNGVSVGDIFNIKYGSSSMGLEEYTTLMAEPVRFTIDQNTQQPIVTGYNAATQEFSIEGSHNAQLQFQVPEPTTLAILGLGLLGFAGASRRKS